MTISNWPAIRGAQEMSPELLKAWGNHLKEMAREKGDRYIESPKTLGAGYMVWEMDEDGEEYLSHKSDEVSPDITLWVWVDDEWKPNGGT